MSSPASRHDEILVAAARIFQRKGYHGTSVRDIADAVGLLKGSLYHYIRSKEELLAKLFDGLLEDTLGELEVIARRDATAVERLREMVRAYARAIVANQGAVGLYLRDWRSLPVRELEGVAARRRRMRALFSGVIAEGTASGELAPGDPNVAALAILGMCNWMYEWYRPDGRLTSDAVIDELAERAVRSVRP